VTRCDDLTPRPITIGGAFSSPYRARFKYQAKCLGWLRDAYAILGDDSRAVVDQLLAGTRRERLVQ